MSPLFRHPWWLPSADPTLSLLLVLTRAQPTVVAASIAIYKSLSEHLVEPIGRGMVAQLLDPLRSRSKEREYSSFLSLEWSSLLDSGLFDEGLSFRSAVPLCSMLHLEEGSATHLLYSVLFCRIRSAIRRIAALHPQSGRTGWPCWSGAVHEHRQSSFRARLPGSFPSRRDCNSAFPDQTKPKQKHGTVVNKRRGDCHARGPKTLHCVCVCVCL